MAWAEVYFLASQDYREPFYVKKVLGTTGMKYFYLHVKYLENDPRTTPEMREFLNFLMNPIKQILDFPRFKYLYKKFINDYTLIFQTE